MDKFRALKSQSIKYQCLLRSIAQVIVTSDHLTDFHQGIINHNHIVVNRYTIRTHNDKITENACFKIYFTFYLIRNVYNIFLNFKTDCIRCAGCFKFSLLFC